MIGRSIESNRHALSAYYYNCGEKKDADQGTRSVRTGLTFDPADSISFGGFFFDRTSEPNPDICRM